MKIFHTENGKEAVSWICSNSSNAEKEIIFWKDILLEKRISEIRNKALLEKSGALFFSDWGRFFFRKGTVPNQKNSIAIFFPM